MVAGKADKDLTCFLRRTTSPLACFSLTMHVFELAVEFCAKTARTAAIMRGSLALEGLPFFFCNDLCFLLSFWPLHACNRLRGMS